MNNDTNVLDRLIGIHEHINGIYKSIQELTRLIGIIQERQDALDHIHRIYRDRETEVYGSAIELFQRFEKELKNANP